MQQQQPTAEPHTSSDTGAAPSGAVPSREGMRISAGDAGAAAMQSQSPTPIGTEASQMHPALEEARSQ